MQINMCSRQSFNSFARQSIKRWLLKEARGWRKGGIFQTASSGFYGHKQVPVETLFVFRLFFFTFFFYFFLNWRRRRCNLISHLSNTFRNWRYGKYGNHMLLPSNWMFTWGRCKGDAHASSLIRHVVWLVYQFRGQTEEYLIKDTNESSSNELEMLWVEN